MKHLHKKRFRYFNTVNVHLFGENPRLVSYRVKERWPLFINESNTHPIVSGIGDGYCSPIRYERLVRKDGRYEESDRGYGGRTHRPNLHHTSGKMEIAFGLNGNECQAKMVVHINSNAIQVNRLLSFLAKRLLKQVNYYLLSNLHQNNPRHRECSNVSCVFIKCTIVLNLI